MRSYKGKVFVLMVVLVGFGAMCGLAGGGLGTAKESRAEALELLDNFAKTHEVFKSFTAKTEVLTQFTVKSLSPRFPTSQQERHRNIDFRFDQENKRTNRRTYQYGDLPAATPTVPKDNPQYTSSLKNQKISRWYGRADITSDPGRITLVTDYQDAQKETMQSLSRGFKGHEAFGYLYGHDERIDEILRDTNKIRVRRRMQKVGDYNCYVIEATTHKGKYTLWIDPEHGYNLAKAKCLITKGNSLYETTAKKGERYYTSLDNVKFEQVDGTWVPFGAEIVYDWKVPGKYKYRETIQFKAKEYQLNPDHDALRSFDSDDIQNGAKVTIIDETGVSDITYYWQYGKVVDKNGREVDLDKLKVKKRK